MKKFSNLLMLLRPHQWLKNLFTSGREEDTASEDRPASMLTN